MDNGFRLMIILILVAILLFLTAPICVADDDQMATVHTFGRSRIHGDDMSASRNAAIADSLVTAVTTVLTELIPPQTATGNFQVLSESVLANTDQFVVDYKMLTESVYGNVHRVMVKVNVSVPRLTQALDAVGVLQVDGGLGASEVEVHIEGISGNVASFVRFRGALSNMSGVDSVQRREMQQDTAVLAVLYQGSASALADALQRQAFDSFRITIYAAEDGRIQLQLFPIPPSNDPSGAPPVTR
jgi:hypothetical protein